jgi:uncharacterized lipoprotein YddW (UPF0748 family)
MSSKKQSGCGCSSIPISVILLILGGGIWGFTQFRHLIDVSSITKLLPNQAALPNQPQPAKQAPLPIATSPTPTGLPPAPIPKQSPPISTPTPTTTPNSAATATPSPLSREQTAIRGIYLSRYQITNNASEQTIRDRVRYYRSQGFNTIIHGVWGNGCTMYNSNVMQQTFGLKSCPNQFQERWLDWLIDEAHKQGMQVHAYFEKGIKLDKNSPIFNLAIAKRWIVPGVDKTYAGIDHYVLDVEIPEVSNLFRQVQVEFVKKYPTIDAVQWDDYLGYYADLPGEVDRATRLTNFVNQLIADMKRANPNVSFDLCHHNPYWAKRYFAADWQNWKIDRAFIQVYNDANFNQEVEYLEKYNGVAIAETQLHRLKPLINNPKIPHILIFPTSGKPETAAAAVKNLLQSPNPAAK